MVCPHCKKKEFTIEFEEGKFKKLKGADPLPLMKPMSRGEWHKGFDVGLAAQCGCGRLFFVYDLEGESSPAVDSSLRAGHILAWFCPNCKYSFIDPGVKCPSCGRQF